MKKEAKFDEMDAIVMRNRENEPTQTMSSIPILIEGHTNPNFSPKIELHHFKGSHWSVEAAFEGAGYTVARGKTKREALELATDNLAKAYAEVVALSETKKKKK